MSKCATRVEAARPTGGRAGEAVGLFFPQGRLCGTLCGTERRIRWAVAGHAVAFAGLGVVIYPAAACDLLAVRGPEFDEVDLLRAVADAVVAAWSVLERRTMNVAAADAVVAAWSVLERRTMNVAAGRYGDFYSLGEALRDNWSTVSLGGGTADISWACFSSSSSPARGSRR